jgi:Fe-S oxidoreductase
MVEEYCYPIPRKNLGDYYEMTWRCAKCAYCRNVFPSDTENEKFGHQCPPGDRFKYETYFASGRHELARRVIEGKQGLTERYRHILYTCTTCGACEEWCSATTGLYPLRLFQEMKKHFVENDGEILPEHRKVIDGIKRNHNRLNRNNRDRLGWLGDLPQVAPGEADLVYFVGCRSAFKRTEIARSTYTLLSKLGLKVAFLEDERCCGRPLIDIGAEGDAVQLMEHNVEQIKATGASQVLYSCAECFHTFNSIEKYGIEKPFTAVSLSQLLASHLKDKKLSLKGENRRVTFHDPCYLGRHEGVYEAPRNVLGNIEGVELVEMPRNRKNAWCCGSGGGVQEAFVDYSQWIAARRMEEVNEVGADTIVTACPGCKNSLWAESRANRVEILDLSEIIDRIVEG